MTREHETIASQFHAYLATVYTDPGALPLPKDQYTELRRCFFGSFISCMSQLAHNGNLPENEQSDRNARWWRECEGFSISVKEAGI